ncbi:hypothetical protein K9M47_03730 [Candidatus Gracilibacteria bacterium]|nr:hypothetical protein [Candidatus Gracilibacteria bacterium]MCF7898521.1 hypothetical protein [Candidatus Paceibacterota bacterium]
MKKFLLTLSTLVISIFFLLPTISYAGTEAVVTLSPKNPTPYTSVTATLVSYLFNVNTAHITWSVNGKDVLVGVGEKNYTVKTGEVGSRIPIYVRAVTANNEVYEVNISITPESVDIIYETPESYVPLFYEGRSLPGEGAVVKFVALPNISEGGSTIPPSSLSYSWYVSGEFVDNLSGIGKQSALIELDFLRSFTTVKVVVVGPYGTTATKSIDVYPHDVMPLVYTYDDILGTNFTSLITKRFETTKDFTLSLEPFFLSSNGQIGDTVSYRWLLDGLPVTPFGGTLLSMRPKEDSYGARKLSITVSNTKRRLQKVVTDLELIFDTRN